MQAVPISLEVSDGDGTPLAGAHRNSTSPAPGSVADMTFLLHRVSPTPPELTRYEGLYFFSAAILRHNVC